MPLIANTTLFSLKEAAIPIISALAKNWQSSIIVLLAAVIVYQNTFEHRLFFWADTIPYLRDLADEQTGVIREAEAANRGLRDAIDMRNDQIQEWRSITIELERNVGVLEDDILTQQEITRNQVREILLQPTPQSCEASINFLRDHIPDLQYGPREDTE